jgi:hypothetical protein
VNQRKNDRKPASRPKRSVTAGGPSSAPEGHPFRKRAAKIGKNVGRQYVGLLAVLIALLAFVNQRSTNEAQLQVYQANAAAARSHDASLVTYWLQGNGPYSSKPQVVVDNGSSGLITNVNLFLPVPAQRSAQGCSVGAGLRAVGEQDGVTMMPGCKGFVYYRLRDIPPCTVTTTPVLHAVVSPAITSTELGNSVLFFTDAKDNSWDRYGGRQKLVAVPGYKGSSGFDWVGPVSSKPAPGCSS